MTRKAVKVGISLAVVGLVSVGGGHLVWPDDPPFTTYRYRQMCSEPRGFSQAAPRAGSGPRPIFVDSYWLEADSAPTKMDAAALKIWAPQEPSTVQLVACVDHVGQGDFVKRCDYQPDGTTDMIHPNPSGGRPFSYNLFKGRYTLTVYEARTGKLLGRSDLAGTDFRPDVPDGTAGEPCTPHAIADSTGRYKKEGDPTIADMREVMDPYVLK